MGKFRGQYTNTWGEGAEEGGWLEKRSPVVTSALPALYQLPIVPLIACILPDRQGPGTQPNPNFF